MFQKNLYSFILLVGTLFFAVTSPAALKELASDITDALNISATNLEIDNLKGIATYSDDVTVILGDRTLQCDKLVIYNKDGDITKIIAYGSPVGYAGHVADNPEIIHAYSNIMEYDLQNEMFYMRENARVEQGKNVYEAPEIQYDVANEIISSSPSAKGRIHMIIDAESLENL